ncbi:MAG: transcription termination/antitermination protein NusA [Gammaproteobacteria bacterium]|nr:transcription termination/antitermination protein NusA [Gammaproteobacteria bacterium]
MNKSILLVVEAVSHEKRVEKEVIFKALEAALEAATRKKFGLSEEADVRVNIDQATGDYVTYRRWHVLEGPGQVAAREIDLLAAQQKKGDAKGGDVLEEQIASVTFGRIESHMAKQVIVQKVKEAERSQIVSEYKDRVGDILSGVVRKVGRDNIVVEVAPNVEALLKRENIIARESARIGDRLRALLIKVTPEKVGIQLFLSRTHPEFLIKLFKIEVPEIEEGLIEIKGAARDPGIRAKIAVKANDARLDPVGACVGMRGSRVQAVSNELDGERIDIVLWNENPAQFVINAMSPAEVKSIVVDEETHTMEVAVSEEALSQAIGKNGQNVRLASEVTGWKLNVMSENAASTKQEEEAQKLRTIFMNGLNIDETVADIFVREGFTSLEEVAYVPIEELQSIEEFDPALIEELRGRAKDSLLASAMTSKVDSAKVPAADLLAVEGMEEGLAQKLAQKGIVTREDLAEQSVDDLRGMEEMSEELAAKLIMAARAIWFTDSKDK